MAHLWGWLGALAIAFLQPWGKVAADTKHDLAADPSGFLAQALHAYSPIFPLGQIQNQVYGYLFPQGLFFLLTDWMPDWVAQRLWWTIVLGVGYSGALILFQRLGLGVQPLAAALYALSPRVLTTLTAISSETWPVMLAPWVLWPLVAKKPWVGGSLLAVAMMGAVNAAATLAALVPAGLYLAYRRRALIPWCLGVIGVSLWWIIPLLVFARYSVPFVDYIENGQVTTHWLNFAEVLRGTTSWTPFADVERQAGVLLVHQPVFILGTLLVAGIGLVGLLKVRGFWLWLLSLGLGIFVFAALFPSLLDGPLVMFRNVHKFDPLVRLPLAVGIAAIPARHRIAVALAGVVAVGPIFGRLLPIGAYEKVPDYYHEAADYLNGLDTRVLILPEASFARQDWGWTRDDPFQPLLDVPWLLRDGIPLVPPEAIRNLDGPVNKANLERLGVGAVVVRHDSARRISEDAKAELGTPDHHFGELDVYTLKPGRGMYVADSITTVAGGGEALAMLGPGTFKLVSGDAQIVTDTPLAVNRNFGTLDNAASQPLMEPGRDYASVGDPVKVVERGGHASTPDSSAFDGDTSTVFFGKSMDIHADQPQQQLLLHVSKPGKVKISADGFEQEVKVEQQKVVDVPNLQDIRLETDTGLVEVGFGVRRVVHVDAGPSVQQYVFNGNREFTVPRTMTLQMSRPAWIDGTLQAGEVTLTAGTHEIRTRKTVTLGKATPVPMDPVLVTTLATNPGLRATQNGQELEPVEVNAASQGFKLNGDDKVEITFAGERPYQAGLIFGACAGLITLLFFRRPRYEPAPADDGEFPLGLLALGPGLVMVPITWAVLKFSRFGREAWIFTCLGLCAMWMMRAPAAYPQALTLVAAGAVAAALLPKR
nr:alpha-(1->3)-arabinofuranosyltransferase family protein [Corynebacterium pelargi]